MEKQSLESINESPEKRFNFEEIAGIEPAVISLAEQLKEKIDQGSYDTLISDDVGGRIPTLILRKILKTRNPENKLKTFFVASGQNYIPSKSEQAHNYAKLQDYLKHSTKGTQSALLVTQFIHKGNTIAKLSRALKDAGLEDFDVATVDIASEEAARRSIEPELGDNNLYVGGQFYSTLHERHEHLSGVRKSKKGQYFPHPRRATDVLSEDGRDLSTNEWREIFDISEDEVYYAEMKERLNDPEKIAEFERRTNEELTPEKKAEIQRKIKLAREDVNVLADKWNRSVTIWAFIPQPLQQ